jgi:hypothetical protein
VALKVNILHHKIILHDQTIVTDNGGWVVDIPVFTAWNVPGSNVGSKNNYPDCTFSWFPSRQILGQEYDRFLSN